MAKSRIKKRWIILTSVLLVLIGIYLTAPYFIKNYVNKVLSEMKGYKGSVQDINLHFWRGAYQIERLKIVKIGGKTEIPFVDVRLIDLSVEWKSILKGSVVGQIIFKEPRINFVAGPSKEKSQSGVENDWTKPLKKVMPLHINRLEVINGRINFYDPYRKPKVDLDLDKLALTLTNISNVEDKKQKLPSKLLVKATSVGHGNLNIESNLNLLKKLPDFDLNMKFTDINLPAINDFAKAYGKFDFEKGKLSLYSEIAMYGGTIDGYIKPVLEGVQILGKGDKNDTFLHKVWEGFLNVTEKVLENKKKKRAATLVPIKGSAGKVNTGSWETIINVLRNAFIQAFSKNLEGDVDISDALGKKKEEKEDIRILGIKIGERKIDKHKK